MEVVHNERAIQETSGHCFPLDKRQSAKIWRQLDVIFNIILHLYLSQEMFIYVVNKNSIDLTDPADIPQKRVQE